MNYPETNEKSYQCPTGPMAWLNDIEITKGPYLASIFLLVLNIVLVRQPFFTIDIPYMESMIFALHEVTELSTLSFIAIILGAVSIFALLVPILKFFEWKYQWFVPVAGTALTESVAAAYILIKKNELMEKTLIGYAYQLLSIEINLTATAWMFIIANAVLVLCSVKMLIDIKNNVRTY